MNLEQIRSLLLATGFPVAYGFFSSPQAVPFICYRVSSSNNVAADNVVYLPVDHVDIELYTDRKDPAAEKKVEDALSGMVWEKSEAYIDTERMYEITYEIEV